MVSVQAFDQLKADLANELAAIKATSDTHATQITAHYTELTRVGDVAATISNDVTLIKAFME